ncbi:MAG: alpha/beta fold hydrolase [Pseudomonadota bacterium]
MRDIVLVHSPLVGPTSLAPTADALERGGLRCHLPVAYVAGGEPPSWRDWSERLIGALPPVDAPLIVGHSMGGLLAARLAGDLGAAGMICLDAAIPPETGETPTVEPAFRAFLDTLPLRDGRLPRWADWWDLDVFENIGIPADARAAAVRDMPRLPLRWFDDAFAMPDWSAARRGFVRTSLTFVEEARKAEAMGWPVVRLKGIHLHPMTAPAETAEAILACSAAMGLAPSIDPAP